MSVTMPPANPNHRRKSPKGHASRPEYAHCFLCPGERCHALAPCGALDLAHAAWAKLAAAVGGPQEGRWVQLARACEAEAFAAGAGPDARERALAAAVPDPERRTACRRLVRIP